MNIIKGVIDKVASRKLAVTAAAGAAAATGAVEITLPVAIVAASRISLVRGWSIRGATEARQGRKKSGTAVRAAPLYVSAILRLNRVLDVSPVSIVPRFQLQVFDRGPQSSPNGHRLSSRCLSMPFVPELYSSRP